MNYKKVGFLVLIVLSLAVLLTTHGQRQSVEPPSLLSIQEIAKLATAEAYFDVPVMLPPESVQLWGIPVPFTKKSYLAIGQGKVIAGINTEKITEFTVADGVATIKLPEPEILEWKIESNSWRYWDDGSGNLLQFSIHDIHKAELMAEQQMVERAKKVGLLERANDNAKKTIEKLLRSAGMREVKFI
ncbi:DUF4230 domain-containing protein [Heliophilum fasciatum]|uniref:Uncharacterized protein DUF4230 n=1 Tax=Heliophilum fasciatum TaxID=35700 RepID=A0A4R2RLA2_9FIRM|nr:DUF4230 domain-containing protein [Heliophilum fasciatum]MCW2278387.1 hypothetical protein [Heliophilum fasciatum]TCP63714.1 uncharacterized protein DUF4230 [Heliophilum fasciatum]